MSVETKPNKLVKGLVLDTFHTDVDNTVATYALNSQLEDQEGNHFHYGSEVGTTFIKDIPDNHVVIGHINMERNETVLFTTDGNHSTIGILSRNDDMSYHYEIKVDDTKQTKKLGFKKEGYVRGVYRLLNGCDKVIYFVDGINKDRRININQLDSYKLPTTASVASGIIFDDSLRATIFGLSSATGNIQLIRLLSASPEATANVLANLTSGESLTKLLTASANGIGTAFANLMRTANMISSVEANGTSTANVDIIRLLQGNVSTIGSVNAILDVRTLGTVEIDVTLTGVASSTAILLRAALLESNLTTEASTVLNAVLTRVINAQSQATANTSATAQITVPVSATANATATTEASALLSYAVNATANAMAETTAIAQLSQVINASLNATATSSVEALIGLVLVSTTTASGSVSTADLYINRLLSSSVTATGVTTAEMLIAKLLQSSVTASASTTSDALVSKLASSSITASANTTTDLLVSKLLALTVDGLASVTADLKIADLLSTTINGTASVEALLEAVNTLIGDPYIDNVSLLLQGDDNPSGVTQNNIFKDSSTNNFTITPFGNVTQGTFSPFDRALTNSGGSAYFDGVGDYLRLNDSTNWHFGSGLFSIECWAKKTVASGSYLITAQISSGYNGHQFQLSSTGIRFNSFNNNPTGVSITATHTPDTNWHHYAVSSDGTTLRLFYDGVVVASSTATVIGDSSGNLCIGIDWDQSSAAFNGYISNLRIVKGTAVYTTNFQPSTIPLTAITNTSLLLNFTNAAIFDGVKLNNVETVGGAQISTSIKKYGTGSLQFDGNGDYLRVNGGSLFDFGTGSFTMECFVYLPTGVTQGYLFGTRTGDTGTTIRWCIYISSSTIAIDFWNTSNARIALFAHQTSLTNNVFHHVAVVRNVNEFAIYLNGVKSTTTVTNSTAVANSNLIVDIGQATGGFTTGLPLNGYIDDLRITKGIARYTGTSFPLPTSKFPDLKNTVSVDYLVVAGGGGAGSSNGGGWAGGGGGAGGYRTSSKVINKNQNILITVGEGGNGGIGGTPTGANNPGGLATAGNPSIFDNITSAGGGFGGRGHNTLDVNSHGGNGGSGGGGGGTTGVSNAGLGNTPNTSPSQGNNGAGNQGSTNNPGGGGGSASAASNATGGSGTSNSISNTPVTYSAGGNAFSNGANGVNNTGNGGVGNTGLGTKGGNGGRGIVIVSYPISNGNVIIPAGLFYKSGGSEVEGTGVAATPTTTTATVKIYEFLRGSGNIQFT